MILDLLRSILSDTISIFTITIITLTLVDLPITTDLHTNIASSKVVTLLADATIKN